jgi:hypothetical protein
MLQLFSYNYLPKFVFTPDEPLGRNPFPREDKRQGADVQRLLPQLATYLGHVHIAATQRYLTLTPELLHEASQRFEHYARGGQHE